MEQQIYPADSLKGTLTLPADKSISHRAAMFAALANESSTIGNFSRAADPQSTLDCLQALGVPLEQTSNDVVEIQGVGRAGLKNPESTLDCGNSGTTMRLLSGIVGGAGIEAALSGDDSLNRRPMRRIIEPLRRMGVSVEARQDKFAPLTFKGHEQFQPIRFELPIPSAQLKSCVLLAGLFGESETIVIETRQSRDHTERLLDLPVEEDNGERRISSHSGVTIPSQSYRIPADFSAAAFWLVGGAIHPDAEIEMPGVGLNPTRTALLDILRAMEADISIYNERNEGDEPVADILVRSSELQPVTIDPEVIPNCIDELPILSVAMLFADGVSEFRGAEELRHKETDRLKALEVMLEKAGAEFTSYEDGLRIQGSPHFIPRRSRFDSFHDHRIAMSEAILALMGDSSSVIKNAGAAKISYPTFWEDLQDLVLTN